MPMDTEGQVNERPVQDPRFATSVASDVSYLPIVFHRIDKLLLLRMKPWDPLEER